MQFGSNRTNICKIYHLYCIELGFNTFLADLTQRVTLGIVITLHSSSALSRVTLGIVITLHSSSTLSRVTLGIVITLHSSSALSRVTLGIVITLHSSSALSVSFAHSNLFPKLHGKLKPIAHLMALYKI